MGHLWLKWVGQLWQSKLLFFLEDMLKNTCLSGPRMTMGFSPFELPTRGLLQKGWDHSPPKACFELGAQLSVGIHRAINILITKQIGGGAQ